MLWDVLLHGGWLMYRQPSLSQHFLVNRELIHKLVRQSSVSSSDLILEIGPGKGIITSELLKVSRQVIAVELDRNLASNLPTHPHLIVVSKNFMNFDLPKNPYKVFSNLPFVITNDIFRKLFLAANPPTDSYLIMQTEAAAKFISSGTSRTLISTLIYPWFEVKITHNFTSSDFSPHPKVNTCLVQIKKRRNPLVINQPAFRDFTTYTYTYNPLAKYISPHTWVRKYRHSKSNTSGAYNCWLKNQNRLNKIHRTRTDPKWKTHS